jgi:hypothetical protein
MNIDIEAGQVWETKELPGDRAGIKILVTEVHSDWYVDYVFLRDFSAADKQVGPSYMPVYGNPTERFLNDFRLVAESMVDFTLRSGDEPRS